MSTNIIILGASGKADRRIRKNLDVADDCILDWSKERAPEEFAKIQKQIEEKAGGDFGVVNWIGHGNPHSLFIFKGNKLGPDEIAILCDGVKPKKFVLWSCNTGLLTAQGALNKELWKAYDSSKVKAAMQLTKDVVDVESLIGASFAQQVAVKIQQSSDISVYGAMMGLMPGAIVKFEMEAGPGSHVQWRAQSGNPPISTTPTYRAHYIAVSHGGRYRIICKYSEAGKDKDKFKFTYHSLYCDT